MIFISTILYWFVKNCGAVTILLFCLELDMVFSCHVTLGICSLIIYHWILLGDIICKCGFGKRKWNTAFFLFFFALHGFSTASRACGKWQEACHSVASKARGKWPETCYSIASRACGKWQEACYSVASRARGKWQEACYSVASRACGKWQDTCYSVASRPCVKWPETCYSVASRACGKWQENTRDMLTSIPTPFHPPTPPGSPRKSHYPSCTTSSWRAQLLTDVRNTSNWRAQLLIDGHNFQPMGAMRQRKTAKPAGPSTAPVA